MIADDDPVGEHLGAAGDGAAVAARFADDGGDFAGDGRFVDRGDAFDDFAVAGNQVAGFAHERGRLFGGRAAATVLALAAVASEFRARCVGLASSQSVGLGFAAAFGHRFGEVGEEHGEPEPERDLAGERMSPRR